MRPLFSTLASETESPVAALEAVPEDDVQTTPSPPPLRFGAIPLEFPIRKEPSTFTIIEKKREGGSDYDIWVAGVVGGKQSKDIQESFDIVSLLDGATADTIVTFYISSPGGSVAIALRICAAMKRTPAKIVTVAVGRCCSAGLQIWSCGHERRMDPGSYLMAHGSSHGDAGNSVGVAESAIQTATFVASTMLRPLVEYGVLLEDEFEDILQRRAEIYISAKDYARRMGGSWE